MEKVLELVARCGRIHPNVAGLELLDGFDRIDRRVELAEYSDDAFHQSRSPGVSGSNSRCIPVTSMPSTACATLSGGGMISLISAIATTGKFLMNSRNHIENHPKLPNRMAQSMYVGAYRVHCHGSNSCESDGSKITKRSNHMPRLMNRDSVNSHVVLRRSFCQNRDSGRMELQVS